MDGPLLPIFITGGVEGKSESFSPVSPLAQEKIRKEFMHIGRVICANYLFFTELCGFPCTIRRGGWVLGFFEFATNKVTHCFTE